MFLSIVADYEDLSSPSLLAQCISVLDQVKSDATGEQDKLSFDPSGTSALVDATRNTTKSSSSSSGANDADHSNEVPSVTTTFSELNWTDIQDSDRDLVALSLEEKQQKLTAMFPSVSVEDISKILGLADISFSDVVDRLLTLTFLEMEKLEGSESETPKGIDAFFHDRTKAKKRKAGQKHRKKADDSSRTSSVGSPSTRNPWTTTEDDINFIVGKTDLSAAQVRATYLQAGRNLAVTIETLATEKSDKLDRSDSWEALRETQLIDLKHDFAQLSDRLLYGLLLLSRLPPEAAELAAKVEEHRLLEQVGNRVDLVHYEPVNFDEEPKDVSRPDTSSLSLMSSVQLQSYAANHQLHADTAFAQASAAARRARSDDLMGGAAIYHAEEGHRRAQVAKAYRAAEADARIRANRNSDDTIDLHGATVEDAIRNAKRETQRWWDRMGDARYTASGRDAVKVGFHIVTGVGAHSRHGIAKIGPAVSRALIKEGWKVEVRSGQVSVYGRSRC